MPSRWTKEEDLVERELEEGVWYRTEFYKEGHLWWPEGGNEIAYCGRALRLSPESIESLLPLFEHLGQGTELYHDRRKTGKCAECRRRYKEVLEDRKFFYGKRE